MDEKNFRIFVIVGLIVIFLTTMMNTCNSCSTAPQQQITTQKIDSLRGEITDLKELTLSADFAKMIIEREGLLTEKSTLLNTNQIFLTKKRPDERVLEIDKQLRDLDKKIESYDK